MPKRAHRSKTAETVVTNAANGDGEATPEKKTKQSRQARRQIELNEPEVSLACNRMAALIRLRDVHNTLPCSSTILIDGNWQVAAAEESKGSRKQHSLPSSSRPGNTKASKKSKQKQRAPPMTAVDESSSDEEFDGGWRRNCMKCNKIGNVLLCEGCPNVMHTSCAGLTAAQAEALDQWFCGKCQPPAPEEATAKETPISASPQLELPPQPVQFFDNYACLFCEKMGGVILCKKCSSGTHLHCSDVPNPHTWSCVVCDPRRVCLRSTPGDTATQPATVSQHKPTKVLELPKRTRAKRKAATKSPAKKAARNPPSTKTADNKGSVVAGKTAGKTAGKMSGKTAAGKATAKTDGKATGEVAGEVAGEVVSKEIAPTKPELAESLETKAIPQDGTGNMKQRGDEVRVLS